MNNKLKNIIILLIIISLIIMSAIVIVLINLNKRTVENGTTEDIGGDDIISGYAKGESNSISRDSYEDINNCISIYFDVLNVENAAYYGRDENGEISRNIDENEIKQKIYNILGENYKSKNNITVDNVYNKVKTIKEKWIYVPLEASLIQDGDIKSFIVHGLAETLEMRVVDEVFVIINIDVIKNIFSVEPIYGNYNSISKIEISELEKNIKESEDNKFILSSETNESISKDYINLYKELTIGSPDRMYNLLDKEYREKRFGNLDNFKKYIEQNRDKIFGTRLEKYQSTIKDGYTQYVCIDQYDNYYIFKENAVLDYSVILDTYTIDLPEFIEKYENASEKEKVEMNIQKIFYAINSQDYKYVYNKLDDTFKVNNFRTEGEFEEYIKENFFSINKISSGDYEKSGNTHIYNIKYINANNNESEALNKKFVIQLKDGTDFVMSFSMQ